MQSLEELSLPEGVLHTVLAEYHCSRLAKEPHGAQQTILSSCSIALLLAAMLVIAKRTSSLGTLDPLATLRDGQLSYSPWRCGWRAALTSLEGLPRFDLTGNSIPAHRLGNDPAEPPIMPYDGLISKENSTRGLDAPAGASNQLRMGPAGGEHPLGGRDAPGAPAADDDGGVRDMLTPATSKAETSDG